MGSAELWTCSVRARDQFKIHFIHGNPDPGLSKDPHSINTGLNSGYQAMGLAALFGAKKILLLGYDYQRSGGRNHWHPDHPRTMGNGGRLPEWIREMSVLAKDLKAAGVEVINCSRKSALTCFPTSTITEALP